MASLTAKYRPRRLGQLVGQRSAVKVVTGMVEKGVPPTVLLNGPRSTGKTTIARIIAERINCSEPDGVNSCGKCVSCRLFRSKEDHPDILELNAADERGIGTIRRLQTISVLAPRFKRRVIIMDESHALTPQAFQSALKLFEEPPPTCCFLLVTTNPEKMPDTILSRCSPVVLRKIGTEVLANWLVKVAKREECDLDAEGAEFIAGAADGHPREALILLEQVISQGGDASEVKAVVREITEASPKAVVLDFVTALVEADMETCFKLYGKIDNPEHFLSNVVEMLQALLRFLISERLVNSFYVNQFRKLKKTKLGDVEHALGAMGHALQGAKSYILPADVLLDLAILKATAD